jgi:catechol 2,3-dioxygenase-like lactoylglutathione lyase family enzyme
MLTSISVTNVYVPDQDEALAFYVDTLGLRVGVDADLGFMRWLTVVVPGDPGHEILLERPGPPSMDEATAATLRKLVTKGSAGWIGFRTDDCRATYEALRAKGVEFSEELTERSYGIDCALRDPFGNRIRIVQEPPVSASPA